MFAITASKEEYEAYIKLVTEKAQVSKNYLAYFGDIYLTNPKLLPEFDVVTHVPSVRVLLPQHREQGIRRADRREAARPVHRQDQARRPHPVLHAARSASHKAEPIIAKWEKSGPVKRVGEFKTLLVFRKLK